MTVVEHGGRIVLVDTGLMFPTAEMLGIDLVLPDFSYLRERADEIEAIVLTHGHEDHVGALPYVLREIGLPPVIYGGPLTIGLVRSKLEEHRIRDAPLQVLDVGERVDAGPFGLEMIHMSHSIPDSRAVAIETELGTVLATGDYKFDQTPVDGVAADVSRLAELGARGPAVPVRGLDQRRPSRRLALGVVRRPGAAGDLLALRGAGDRHLLRLQRASRSAGDRRRGRSSTAGWRWSGARCARTSTSPPTSGSPSAPSGLLIQPKEIEDFPDEKVIAISTGSQGEPLSALRRMAFNDHRDIELHSGDTVVFSASPIPGNERSVNETIDRIFEIGAQVVTAADAPIHASGHGWQEELKLMLNLTKPRYVLPGARRPPPPAPARRSRRGGRDRPGARLPRPQRGRARDRRGRRAPARAHQRRDDLRRRRRHRRPRRRRAARPAHALGRRGVHRRGHGLGRGRHARSPSRS